MCSHLDLEDFHTSDYVSVLLSRDYYDVEKSEEAVGTARRRLDGGVSQTPSKRRRTVAEGEVQRLVEEETGLEYDCSRFPGVGIYSRLVAGASIDAATRLASGTAKRAIHWDGGRHHAQADQASGFCFVNDAVLGVLALLRRFERVLYVDIDCHAGDGVADAFLFSPRVFTISAHCYEPGFFPGAAGSPDIIGSGEGEGYHLNVGLRAGCRDDSLCRVLEEVIPHVVRVFEPEAIVCVAGCDGLARDPLGRWNLTPEAFSRTMHLLGDFDLPLLVLGGGGYDRITAAICWAHCCAALLGEPLGDRPIPPHDLFEAYACVGFSTKLDCNRLMTDENDDAFLSQVVGRAVAQIDLTASRLEESSESSESSEDLEADAD
jgi:histone deacetylase 8